MCWFCSHPRPNTSHTRRASALTSSRQAWPPHRWVQTCCLFDLLFCYITCVPVVGIVCWPSNLVIQPCYIFIYTGGCVLVCRAPSPYGSTSPSLPAGECSASTSTTPAAYAHVFAPSNGHAGTCWDHHSRPWPRAHPHDTLGAQTDYAPQLGVAAYAYAVNHFNYFNHFLALITCRY